MGRRLDVCQVKLRYLADCFQNRAKLRLDLFEVGLGYLKTSQASDVEHVFPGYCHGAPNPSDGARHPARSSR